MPERIHVFRSEITSPTGIRYRVSAWGEPAEGGVWHGWLELVPGDGGAAVLTDRETTQPDRRALEYWASGLEPVYLEGALERAVRRKSA